MAEEIVAQDIPLSPTLGETLKSSAWRTPTASLLYQPLLVERMFPSDPTPVDDGDIETRLREENLTEFAGNFLSIDNRGELETQIEKIKHERRQNAVSEASGWTGFGIDILAGALDPISLATFKATSGASIVRAGMASKSFGVRAATVAGEGAVGGAVAAGAIVAGQDTTTIEEAPGIILGSALLPVALYSGGTVAKHFLGKAADMVPPDKLEKLGNGVKDDLRKFEETLEPSTFKALDTEGNPYVRAKLQHEDGTVFTVQSATETGDGPFQVTKGDEVVGKFDNQADAFKAIGPDAEAAVRPKTLRPEVERIPETIIQTQERLVKRAPKDDDPDINEIARYTGREKVNPYDLASFKLAKSLAGDKIAKNMLSLGVTRGSPALELATSNIPAARRANSILNFTKAAYEDHAAPASFYALKETELMPLRGKAVTEMTGAFKSWRKENLGTPRVPVPVVGGAVSDLMDSSLNAGRRALGAPDNSERTFLHQVYHAVIYGDDLQSIPDPAMRRAAQNKHVQAAAKSFKQLDDKIGEMMVKAGLIRGHRLKDGHIGRNYDMQAVSRGSDKFVELEAEAAYQFEWNDIVNKAKAREAIDTANEIADYQKRLKQQLDEFDAATPDIVADVVKARKSAARIERDATLERLDKEIDEFEAAFEKAEKPRLEAENDRLMLAKIVAANRDSFKRAKKEGWTEEERLQYVEEREDGIRADFGARLNRKIDEEKAPVYKTYDKERKKAFKAWRIASAEGTREGPRTIKSREAERIKIEDGLALFHQKLMTKIRATRAEATSEARRIDTMVWARRHAEGVRDAITTGQTGSRAVDRGGAGGNVRGSRIARNVYMTDRQLLENGFLDTDIYRAVDKAIRVDGADAVLATLFRRPLTPDEVRMTDRGDPDAWWADGDDKYTAPDLELKSPIDEIRKQGAELATTVGREKADAETTRMIENLELSLELARGTHRSGTNSLGQTGRGFASLWKAMMFTYYMGRAPLTNIGDIGRLVSAHGLKEPMRYFTARFSQKVRDTLSGNMGMSRAEIKEALKDANVGFESVNFARASGFFDIMDPYSAASFGSRMDRASGKLTNVGARMFGIHALNDLLTTWSGGIAMNRIVRLAYSKGPLNARDAEWAKFAGFTESDLAALRTELSAQGITKFEPYKTHTFTKDQLSDEMGRKVFAAIARDVRTTIITPNAANLPAYMQNPLLQVVMQFRSYSMEAQSSIGIRRGQMLSNKDYSITMQGLVAMTGMAYVAWLSKALLDSYLYASDDPRSQNLEKALNAHNTDLGGLIYQLMDYGGLSPMLTMYNNMIEDAAGVGIKKEMQGLFEDENPYLLATSSRSQAEGEPGTLIGPGYRQLRRAGKVARNIREGEISRSTVSDAVKLLPYTQTFYLRGVSESAVDAIQWGLDLPDKQGQRSGLTLR